MQIKKTLTPEFYVLNACSYLGSRYYNPRESVWLSVDPPLINGKYMNGEHNGGVYNSFNLNGYIYCYQNPVKLLDPDGNQTNAVENSQGNGNPSPDRKIVATITTPRKHTVNIYEQDGLINFRADSDVDTDGAGNTYKNSKTGQGQTSLKGGAGVFKNSRKDDDVNPNDISYTVVSGKKTWGNLKKEGVFLGDVAYSCNIENGSETYSILADIGPAKKLGENSVLANKQLGDKGSGFDSNSIITIIFPGSRDLFNTSEDTNINAGGQIPNQSQIDAAGKNLQNQYIPTINSIIGTLQNEPKIKKFD